MVLGNDIKVRERSARHHRYKVVYCAGFQQRPTCKQWRPNQTAPGLLVHPSDHATDSTASSRAPETATAKQQQLHEEQRSLDQHSDQRQGIHVE